MARGERRCPDDMDVGLDRLASDLTGGLEERADIDIESEIGKGGGDHLLAAVVAVLPHLRDENSRTASVRIGERVDLGSDGHHRFGVGSHFAAIHPFDGPDLGHVTTVDRLKCIADLSDGGLHPGGVDGEGQQVALAARSGIGERGQRRFDRTSIALRSQLFQLRDLCGTHLGVAVQDLSAGRPPYPTYLKVFLVDSATRVEVATTFFEHPTLIKDIATLEGAETYLVATRSHLLKWDWGEQE